MQDDQGYLKPLESFANLQKINDSPPMYMIEDFLSLEECEQLINAGTPMLKQSVVVDPKQGRVSQQSRTSESAYLDRTTSKWLLDRCALLLRKPTSDLESVQVCRYKNGQYYREHLDSFNTSSPSGQDCMRTGGQRIATVLMYLNDVEEGGGTLFSKLGVRVLPQRGRAVIFFPSKMDGTVDSSMLHTAENAVDEKWVSQVWVRQHSFRLQQ